MTTTPPRQGGADVYRRMQRTLDARRYLSKPLSLAGKLVLSHLDDPASAKDLVRGESYVQLRPDRVLLQDVLGQTAMLQFMQTGRDRTAVPATIHCDHLIQARTGAELDL